MLNATEYNAYKNARRDLYISISQAMFLTGMISTTIFLIIESARLVI
jgi:hypothetical protein